MLTVRNAKDRGLAFHGWLKSFHSSAFGHVARGSIGLNGQVLNEGDGVHVWQERMLELANGNDAEVPVFDLRPHELTGMA